MKNTILLSALFLATTLAPALAGRPSPRSRTVAPKSERPDQKYPGWTLVWSDEFDRDGTLDSASWQHEKGFVRNHELQWYQPDNAFCRDGVLVIEGRRERIRNPHYDSQSRQWKNSREYAEYSASSINTRGRREFLYGRFEIRARIDTSMGLWPAIWTLGSQGWWPSNGEIDLMESYPVDGVHHILANVACLGAQRTARWDSRRVPLDHFLAKDAAWPSRFHIWRMDWDSTAIRLYLDDELLNETLLQDALNPDGKSPFRQPHYLLLNLAIGGDNGGDPSRTVFPNRYEIDYVRVYQPKSKR